MDIRVLVAPPVVALLAGLGAVTGLVGRALLARLPRAVPWPGKACPAWLAALWALTGILLMTGIVPLARLPLVLALSVLAVLLVHVDLTAGRLPNALTLPAYPLLGAAAILAEPGAWPRILGGAVLLGGVHLLTHWFAPNALGGGDVKLAGALGLAIGAHGWPAILACAPLAAVCSLGLAARLRRRAVPHGPGLLTAGWLLVAG